MTNPNESSSSSKTNKKTTKEPEKSTPPPPPPPHPQGQNPSATATPAAPANPPQRTSVPAPSPFPPAPGASKRGEAGGSSSAARKPSAAAANVPMAAVPVAVGGGGSSAGVVGLPPQQAPQRLKASEIVGPETCSVCNKSFGSRKALYGHMRSHPERNWRGINPPPNFGSHAAGPRPRLADQPSRPSGQVSYGAGSSGGQPLVGQNIDLNQPQVEIDLNKPAVKDDSE